MEVALGVKAWPGDVEPAAPARFMRRDSRTIWAACLMEIAGVESFSI